MTWSSILAILFIILKFLPNFSVPIILYLIVCSSWKPSSDEGPSVSQELVEPDDELLFINCYISSLDIRSEIVQPSQSAALPTPL
uniref:Tannin-related R2R3 MYB transcription factor n=1 Tax=Rhizophora mucronata TaxID=61149 RepID=A0A2P2JE36_RHIMU